MASVVTTRALALRIATTGSAILATMTQAFVGAALACPVCNTETGVAVRAGILNESFVASLLGTLAPFPVLLAAVAALHYGWTIRTPSRSLRPRARDGARSDGA